jgi:hypothetical protein
MRFCDLKRLRIDKMRIEISPYKIRFHEYVISQSMTYIPGLGSKRAIKCYIGLLFYTFFGLLRATFVSGGEQQRRRANTDFRKTFDIHNSAFQIPVPNTHVLYLYRLVSLFIFMHSKLVCNGSFNPSAWAVVVLHAKS